MKERGLAYNFHPPAESQYVAPGLWLFPFRKAAGLAGPEMAAVFAKHPGLALNGAELRLCHDHEFLYLGLRLAFPGRADRTS